MLISTVLLMALPSFAQQKKNLNSDGSCGTILTKEQHIYMDKTRAQREAMKLQLNNKVMSTVTVPVVAHIIRRTNGTGGLNLNNLNIAMNDLNEKFEQLDFQFNLCETNYIDDDTYHDNAISNSILPTSLEYSLTVPNRQDDKLNIFFVPVTETGGSWAAFPSLKALYNKDWIIMSNLQATNGSTIPHEVGHWFNLYHTHEDYFGDELVDGSNCGPNVGDGLCDTPADPRLTYDCVTMPCTYICDLTDANGDTYTPDPTNLMSYSQKHCRTYFSPGQRARMLVSYNLDRTNLANSCNCTTDLDISGLVGVSENYQASNSITSTQFILSSNGDVEYKAGSLITLNPGFHVIEDAVFHAYIGNCSSTFSKESGAIAYQDQNVENDFYAPDLSSENTNRQTPPFSTASNFRCYPNPFESSTTIEYNLEEAGTIQLSIHDLNGRLVKVLVDDTQTNGTHKVVFDGSTLPAGVYLVKFQTAQSIRTAKLMLVR